MEEILTWLLKVNRVAGKKLISERTWRICRTSIKDFFYLCVKKNRSCEAAEDDCLCVFVCMFMIFLRILNVTVIKGLDLKILKVKVYNFWVAFNDQSIINALPLHYPSKDLTLNSKQDSEEILSATCHWWHHLLS